MKYFEIKDTQTLATLTPSEFEFYLKKYLEHQKQINSSYNSMSMITNTVNHFCTMNDIVINSRKISKFKTPTGNGKGRGQEHDEAYTREDIQKLLNVAPLRMKVCILVFASTGMRKAALASIQRRHLEKIEDKNVYKVTVYPGIGGGIHLFHYSRMFEGHRRIFRL
jgi:integrase